MAPLKNVLFGSGQKYAWWTGTAGDRKVSASLQLTILTRHTLSSTTLMDLMRQRRCVGETLMAPAIVTSGIVSSG